MADQNNVNDFMARLNAIGKKQIDIARRAVDQFGNHVIGDAAEIAPVKTGDLKASATELPATQEGPVITKVVGFNVFYAVFVHEVLTVHHDQGEAKFLEKTVRSNTPKFGPFVANQIKKAE